MRHHAGFQGLAPLEPRLAELARLLLRAQAASCDEGDQAHSGQRPRAARPGAKMGSFHHGRYRRLVGMAENAEAPGFCQLRRITAPPVCS